MRVIINYKFFSFIIESIRVHVRTYVHTYTCVCINDLQNLLFSMNSQGLVLEIESLTKEKQQSKKDGPIIKLHIPYEYICFKFKGINWILKS